MVGSFPWYEKVEGPPLDQGDCLLKLPIIRPIYDSALIAATDEGHPNIDAAITRYDCIVMTQTCDLAHDKLDEVILCPFEPLDVFAQENKNYHPRKIARGDVPGFHLLNQNADPPMPVSVVSFRQIFSVPKAFLSEVARAMPPRPRLLPPYREHLSQAFARYFMRVGLPVEIEGV